jgi:hypothetical protein
MKVRVLALLLLVGIGCARGSEHPYSQESLRAPSSNQSQLCTCGGCEIDCSRTSNLNRHQRNGCAPLQRERSKGQNFKALLTAVSLAKQAMTTQSVDATPPICKRSLAMPGGRGDWVKKERAELRYQKGRRKAKKRIFLARKDRDEYATEVQRSNKSVWLCKYCTSRMSTKKNLLVHIHSQHDKNKWTRCGRCDLQMLISNLQAHTETARCKRRARERGSA